MFYITDQYVNALTVVVMPWEVQKDNEYHLLLKQCGKLSNG